jgi:WD40 repeat protein
VALEVIMLRAGGIINVQSDRPRSDGHPRFAAFISYSHADTKWGRWLHKALETYRLPRSLVGTTNRAGQVLESRLGKVFRDRDELTSAPSLEQSIRDALERSNNLVVVCSPRSARSAYVNQEVIEFKKLGKPEHVHALIVDGEPNASRSQERADEECLPAALRFDVGVDGRLSTAPAKEVLACDARRTKDGKQRAKLKLIAGLLNLDFDLLYRRDQRRRRQRMAAIGTGAAAILAVVSVLGWQAWISQKEAAERARLNRHEAYVAAVNLAEKSHREQSPSRVVALLAAQAPQTDTEDLREFAWRRMWRLYHGERSSLRFQASAQSGADLAISLDGRTLAVALEGGGPVIVWDAETGEERHRLVGHGRDAFTDLAFVPGGNALLSAGEDGTVRLWDTQSGEEQRILHHDQPVTGMLTSPDGRRLATSVSGGWHSFSLWDLSTGESRQIETLGQRGSPCMWFFTPDGETFALGYERGRVVLHDAKTGAIRSELTSERDGRCASAAISPNGATVAMALEVGSDGSEVRLLDRRSGREGLILQVPDTEDNGIIDLSFSPDGRTIVLVIGDPDIASPKQTSKVVGWDVASGRERFTLGQDETGFASLFAFAPDGRAFATAGEDNVIRLWDAETGTLRNVLGLHHDRIWEMAFSADSKTLGTVSRDQTAKLWHVDILPETLLVPRRPSNHSAVAFSADGTRIATGSWDGVLELWDTASHEKVMDLQAHARAIDAITFSPDGRLVASAAQDGIVKIWDAQTLTEHRSFTGHPGWVSTFFFDGRSVIHLTPGGVTAAGAGRVHAWNLETGSEVAGLAEPARVVAVSQNGERIATIGGYDDGSGSCKLTLWDLGAGASQVLTQCQGAGADLTRAAFSPDGQYLAVGGPELPVSPRNNAGRPPSGAMLYHLGAPTERTVLEFPVRFDSDGSLEALEFSPDGRTLATVSIPFGENLARDDQYRAAITLWRVPSGEKLTMFVERNDLVCDGYRGSGCARYVRFSPDGRFLAYVSGARPPQAGSNEIVIWDLISGRRQAREVSAQVNDFVFAPDSKTFATVTNSSGPADPVVLWSVQQVETEGILGYEGVRLDEVAVTDEGAVVALVTEGGAVTRGQRRLWNLTYGETLPLPELGTEDEAVAAVLSPDGRTVAFANGEARLLLWDLVEGRRIATFEGTLPTDGVFDGVRGSGTFSPDGRLIATVQEETIILRDIVAGTQRATFSGTGLTAISANGIIAATPIDCHTLRVYNLASQREELLSELGDQCIRAVAVSPDGETIVTAGGYGRDAEARLWSVETGELRASLDEYAADAAILAFSPEGRTLATAGVGGSVDLWDPEIGRRLMTLDGPKGIAGLGFSADGRTLAVAYPHHVRLWHAIPRTSLPALAN